MNREEQILHQANICFQGCTEQAIVFAQGARWADHTANPEQKVYVIMIPTTKEQPYTMSDCVSTYFFRTIKEAEKFIQTYDPLRKSNCDIVELYAYAKP